MPGQGFERVGESYADGARGLALGDLELPDGAVPHATSLCPSQVYSDAMKNQSLSKIVPAVDGEQPVDRPSWMRSPDDSRAIAQSNTAIVPLPVKPIKLGNQTYFEPQRAEVADLLKSWWGVDASKAAAATRVILYNGAGTPGIAGEAAQQLIRGGFRVVDTKNADNFNYATTKIVVQRGDVEQGEEIATDPRCREPWNSSRPSRTWQT